MKKQKKNTGKHKFLDELGHTHPTPKQVSEKYCGAKSEKQKRGKGSKCIWCGRKGEHPFGICNPCREEAKAKRKAEEVSLENYRPSIGKTAIVKQAAKKAGRKLWMYKMKKAKSSDLMGLPTTTDKWNERCDDVISKFTTDEVGTLTKYRDILDYIIKQYNLEVSPSPTQTFCKVLYLRTALAEIDKLPSIDVKQVLKNITGLLIHEIYHQGQNYAVIETPIKTKEEVEKELVDAKKIFEEKVKKGNDDADKHHSIGWIEALEWVLGK